MLRLFTSEKASEKLRVEQEAEQQRQLEAKKAEEEKKRQEEEVRLAKIRQLDVEARQNLQSPFKERYVLAKQLGFERQAEIARIEGITNTRCIDLIEQMWKLRKVLEHQLGTFGGKYYHGPDLNASYSSVEEFDGEIPFGALAKYQEVKHLFDEVKILHFNIGKGDPIMYGVKNWNGEELHFLIMMWA